MRTRPSGQCFPCRGSAPPRPGPLGFKSVYTVTDLPEVHSGDEDFAIDDYVFPIQAPITQRQLDETQIVLPLRREDPTAAQDITAGFRRLRPSALLFLRNIEEISWSVEGGASGFYLRNPPEALGDGVRRVSVIGHETGQDEVDQNWLVFHRDVFSDVQKRVGRVEVAFSLIPPKEPSGRWSVQQLPTSPLVVFFPTVVETHLGFLVQGPYPFEGAATAAGAAAADAFSAALSRTYLEPPDLGLGAMADDARGRADGYREAAGMLADAAGRPLASLQALQDAVTGTGAEAETALADAASSADALNTELDGTAATAGSAGAAARDAGAEAADGADQAATGWGAVTAALSDYATKARNIGSDIGQALVPTHSFMPTSGSA